ncbi:DUF4395 domain-containing protein [Halobacillus yeomjeoni]|uniref:DUF4395 domain-containing protein n=1 Tax=Halobacillus yeomjeoni TaxID=311194 RepID=A0A931HXL3_9BACI|nr:DUF4395 domain-containing protein [Halobacillus yeomjeoni]MBH0231279.1 DUF4395 domain-containing protein [Halobacillus yeomjeoni]
MGIPKPLVQTNQAFVVLSVLSGLLIHHSLLLIPLAIGVYTLVTKTNPIIKISRPFLSKKPDQYIQEDKDQQLFNQWIATICVGAALGFFSIDLNVLGYLFGGMVIVAAGVALMGYCIGCTIRYRYMMWKHRRTSTSS